MGKIISLVGTKGGIIKSTIVQCVSTSKVFEKYKVGILEGDSQGSLAGWVEERSKKMKPLNIEIINHNPEIQLKDEISKYRSKFDFLFVDLPGESRALNLTKTALVLSDLCIFPIRVYHKDINAFDKNLRPILAKAIELRNKKFKVSDSKKHYKLLATFAHHSTDKDKYLDNFSSIKIINKFKNIHRDRLVYTYFSVGGLTLREYKKQNKFNLLEQSKANKAINDIELIAQEILDYFNNN